MLDFPGPPLTNGQFFAAPNGVLYQYAAPPGAWLTVPPPGNAAGGDLAGSYPNPTIRPSVVLTGDPTRSTPPSPGDSDLSIATTGFVQDAIATAGSETVDARDYGLAEVGDSFTPKRNVAAINEAIRVGAERRVRTVVAGGVYSISGEIKTRSHAHIVYEPSTVIRADGWSFSGSMMTNSLANSASVDTVQDNVTIEGLYMDFAGYPPSPRFLAQGGGGGINGVGGNGTLILNAADNGTTGTTGILERIISATFTANSGGTTTMVVSNVTGFIPLWAPIVGTGVPSLTWFTQQLSGPLGGAGTYLTNNATTGVAAAWWIREPVFLKLDQGTGSGAGFYSIINYSGGFGGTVTIAGPWDLAAPAPDTVYNWGWNDNAIGCGAGTSNFRTRRTTVVNLAGDQLFSAGGKGINFEQGNTNAVIEDTVVIGQFNKPAISAVFVQGRTGTYGNGAKRNADLIQVTRVYAENCGSAVSGGGADADAAATSSAASIAGTTLTVGGTVTGLWRDGVQVIGAGINSDTMVLQQLTTTAPGQALGLAGTYQVDISQTVVGPISIAGYELAGDPNQLSAIINGVRFRNCGFQPFRFAGSDWQKSGIITLFRAQNLIINDVEGYNDPGYPGTSPGWLTDYTNRLGVSTALNPLGSSGAIGAVIWGWARNTVLSNILYGGDADTFLRINRCRANGEDAGPTGKPIDVFDLKGTNLRHFNGTLGSVVAVDSTASVRATNSNVKMDLQIELSDNTVLGTRTVDGGGNVVLTPGLIVSNMNGYTNTTLDIYEGGSGTRIKGTADQINDAGNLLSSFRQGQVNNLNFGDLTMGGNLTLTGNELVGGYLRVGSTAAPSNTTAGDLTATRMSLGNGSLVGVLARITGNMTGSANVFGMFLSGTVQGDVTGAASVFNATAVMVTGAKAASVSGVRASQTAIPAGGATITSNFGFNADGTQIGGTDNFGLLSNIANTIDANHDFELGGFPTISGFTVAANVVTVTTAIPHLLDPTQIVTVAAANVTAGAFITGAGYVIQAVGTTDFTLIGASSNTVGVIFTATGAGTGTGTAMPAINGSGITVATTPTGTTFTYARTTGDSSGHAGGTVTPSKRWNIQVQGLAPNSYAGLSRFGSNVPPYLAVDVAGSFGRGNPIVKTADFTVAVTENWLANNKAGSTCVVTLPVANTVPGREITIANYQAQLVNSASANVVPTTGAAAAAAILPATAGSKVTLVADGPGNVWRAFA